jgi:hypothetical protein
LLDECDKCFGCTVDLQQLSLKADFKLPSGGEKVKVSSLSIPQVPQTLLNCSSMFLKRSSNVPQKLLKCSYIAPQTLLDVPETSLICSSNAPSFIILAITTRPETQLTS